MHIDRQNLLKIATEKLKKNTKNTDCIDLDFVLWLTHVIVMLDPKESCQIIGSRKEWEGLDMNKSLFYTPDGCGLPIGNLTSQLFSNVYMNPFDQMVKRLLHFLHYGRYVDDSATISSDRQRLTDAIPLMRDFLKDELCLGMHMGKTQIIDVRYGVEFLGGFILPGRTYMSHAAVRRLRQNIDNLKGSGPAKLYRSINSMLGVLSHFNAHRLSRDLFCIEQFLKHGHFSDDMTQYYLNRKTQ